MTVTLAMARPQGRLRVSLAREIRAAMAREGLSGVRLGNIIGKSQPYVSRRLSGRLAFDVDDLEVIGRILNVSPSDLIAEAVRRIEPEEPGSGDDAVVPINRC
jgi:transcriptional regulator with XRE-family HTH domain